MMSIPSSARWSRCSIAPSKVPAMPGPEAKSDRLDCRKLATFAQKGLLRAVPKVEQVWGWLLSEFRIDNCAIDGAVVAPKLRPCLT